MRNANQIRSRNSKPSGFMMIELMISMVVLSVGLGGLLVLLVSAMYTDTRSSGDTSSTMVAEHVLEQITAEGLGADLPLTVTDCGGNALNIATLRPAATGLGTGNGGANGGNGAALTAVGIIDWNNQTSAQVPAGYAINYVACGANGTQTTYDVRWDIIRMSNNTRMTVIGARPTGSQQLGGLRFVFPANLRTID
jgi:type II secretory pathway pseudopilin PulG